MEGYSDTPNCQWELLSSRILSGRRKQLPKQEESWKYTGGGGSLSGARWANAASSSECWNVFSKGERRILILESSLQISCSQILGKAA